MDDGGVCFPFDIDGAANGGLTSHFKYYPSINLSGSSQASGSSVVATQAPSITDIKGWSTEHLIQHLQAKFPDDLDGEDLGIFQKQKIRGRAFLTLTEEKLMADGMKRGSAAVIAGYVNELNATGKYLTFIIVNPYVLSSPLFHFL